MATSINKAISGSMALISRRDRMILLLVAFAQTFLALFDLVGIVLIGVVVSLGTSNISGNTSPLITKLLETFGLTSIPLPNLLLSISILAGVLLVTKSIVSFLITKSAYRFLAFRQAIVSRNLLQDFLSRPILFIQEKSSQDTTFALTAGVNAAMLGVLGSAVIMASELPVLLVLGIGLCFIDVGVTLFTILFFGLIGLFIHRVLASQGRKLGAKVAKSEIETYEGVQEAINTYKEISVLGRKDYYIDKIWKLRVNTSDAQGSLQVMNQATKYIYEIMLIVGGGLLMTIQLATHDIASAVTVISVFLAAASRLTPSLLRMQTAAISIISSSAVAETTIKLSEKLRDEPKLDPTSSSSHFEHYQSDEFTGEVKVSKVKFTYPGESTPAIKNLSLTLQPGMSLALVGPTGAGKSTFADIILGLMEPGSGNVLISGKTPKEIVETHPGIISYVPQTTSLIRGNIRDNVALGLPTEVIDDELVWEALSRAQLSDFLKSSRSGLETVVGENGVKLSGGQRQRLGLARALYSRPKLLVLDEATSALDVETEAAIIEALNELEGEVTTITIAHRLSTIRNCDLIIYMEKGAEVARGNFNELRKLSSSFDEQASLSGL